MNDERTHQLAKRIRQAEQIITAYNANVEAVYDHDFMFSEEATKVMIPQSIYSGQLKPLSVIREEQAEREKKLIASGHFIIPVSADYEGKRGKDRDNIWHVPVDEYEDKLSIAFEDILPRVKGTLHRNLVGELTLTAKIEGYEKEFKSSFIPEHLRAFIDVSLNKEEYRSMQGTIKGKFVDLVAADVFSPILMEKENQSLPVSFTSEGNAHQDFDEVKKTRQDDHLSVGEYAVLSALQSHKGITKGDMPKADLQSQWGNIKLQFDSIVQEERQSVDFDLKKEVSLDRDFIADNFHVSGEIFDRFSDSDKERLDSLYSNYVSSFLSSLTKERKLEKEISNYILSGGLSDPEFSQKVLDRGSDS